MENTQEFLYKNSKFMYKLAWFMEIMVVFIGLSISAIIAMQGMENSSLMGIVVAAGPFVIVAFAELAKIPVAVMIYYTKKSKILYILFGLFVCAITFETLLNGFERNFSTLNLDINKKKMEITALENNIDLNSDKITLLETEYNQEVNELEQEQTDAKKQYRNTVAIIQRNVKNSNKELPQLQTELNEVQGHTETLKQERRVIVKEWITAKKELFNHISEQANTQTDSVAEERTALRSSINTTKKDMAIAVDDASFLTVDSVRKEHMARISKLENQLQELNMSSIGGKNLATQSNANKEQLDMVNIQYQTIADDLANSINQYSKEAKELKAEIDYVQVQMNKRANAQISYAQNILNKDVTNVEQDLEELDNEFTETKEEISLLNDQNFDTESKIDNSEIEVESLVLSNQIYRMAAYVDNAEKADDIEKQTVGKVAFFWFASLAMICSITGMFLAFASIHLRGIADQRAKDIKLGLIDP